MNSLKLLGVTGFLAASVLCSSCSPVPSSLNPRSPAATYIADLSWVTFVLGGIIWIGVVVLLLGALFRRRSSSDDETPELKNSTEETTPIVNRWVIGGGIVMPTIVLIGLVAYTVATMRAIGGLVPSDEVVIELIGHQWWWEVRYPNQAVVTANEIHIPAGQPIEMKLQSEDVIHSFWAPELHGKFDLVPGRTQSFILQADLPGEYRGQCAEFCGRQHALMGFIVIAQPLEEFNAWLDSQARPAAPPTDDLAVTGQQVFLESRCVECHTIRGTPAAGTDGPDLTHVASRKTLAAGTLTNTPEHLAAWVSDPQTIKPGSLMPVVELSPEQFLAVLAYLESLK